MSTWTKILIRFVICSLFVPVITLARPSNANSWQWWANRLSLGTESKIEAMTRLKSEPQLESKLRSALGTNDKYLAFDVISALKLHSLLEDLLRASANDDSGYFYLAMNTLILPTEMKKFAQVYLERLLDSKTAGSVRLVLLDTLARMSVRLSPAALKDFLLNEKSPELRSAALAYLRYSYQQNPAPEDLLLLKLLLENKSTPTRLKLQALYFAGELNSSQFRKLGRMTDVCQSDFPSKTQSICVRLAKLK